MAISFEVLLGKIEEEINKAKQTKDTSVRNAHLYTVKTLAELGIGADTFTQQIEKKGGDYTTNFLNPSTSKPISVHQSAPLQTEDGANGASIFDF
ncbi:YwdI family protein [Lederbergia sp. NSJ-179]|uniref:YwdI family protein n=1 Tax=Lederbergia sp. NSJ-179 TaxID=2931402 RepID=UPI001FCFE15A|nr:YwdI family protein [Lederbergia sp. NSJ-179]MCJ7841575.1 YwdI family protein [Lederbergia sp. NSJ-179]